MQKIIRKWQGYDTRGVCLIESNDAMADIRTEAPALRDALKKLLEAYVPDCQKTRARGGDGALHPAVLNALEVLERTAPYSRWSVERVTPSGNVATPYQVFARTEKEAHEEVRARYGGTLLGFLGAIHCRKLDSITG